MVKLIRYRLLEIYRPQIGKALAHLRCVTSLVKVN